MKTIITTVGTSVITNFIAEEKSRQGQSLYEGLEKKNCKEDEDRKEELNRLKIKIQNWIARQRPEDSGKICAEIKSLEKIKEEYQDDLKVILLPTDTLLSVLAAEIIQEYMLSKAKDQNTMDLIEYKEEFIIRKTDVHNSIHFKEGIQNLIAILQNQAADHASTIINFSGGYKSFIPYLTLYASIQKLTLCYIYEDSESLITIPALPLDINMEGIGELQEYFMMIEEQSSIKYPKEIKEFEKGNKNHIKEMFTICTEQEGDQYTLSTIGMMLWEIFKENSDVELMEDPTPANQKLINLSDDHGKDVLQKFSEKLVKSSYVKDIINSLPFNPKERNFIRKTYDDGRIEIVLTSDDRGIGLVLQSTGRNKRETDAIAKKLEEKYNK